MFLRHYAQATTTRSSLPSLISSRHFIPPLFPASDRIPYASPADLFRRADDAAVSLPRAMAAAGLHTAMISAHTWLGEETAFAGEFDEARDLSARLEFDPARAYPDAAAVVDEALAWIEAQGRRDWFLYLHLMDTHFPHRAGPEARAFLGPGTGPKPGRFTAAGGLRETRTPLEPQERAWLDALYDGSLRHVDGELARLFQRLERGPSPLIAVTADHGEALMEVPGRFGHGLPPYETVARIPFILWWPGKIAPGRVEALTSGIDVAPTLMGYLGAKLPPGRSFDGRDLSREAGGEDGGGAVILKRAVRTRKWKAIFHGEESRLLDGEAPDPRAMGGELYDLAGDPGEVRNLWSEHPEVDARLLELYRRELAGPWRRYQEAVRSGPPPGPFAIAARHLETSPGLRCTGEVGRLESFFGSGRGWMLFCDPQGDYLLGDQGAGPARIEVAIPSGRYRLRLGILGPAVVTLPGAGPARLSGGAFDPWDWFPWSVQAIPVGEVVVTGDRLSLRLEPGRKGGPLALRYLGLAPADGEAGRTEEDPQRMERLRSLGYVD